jgi:CRP-like cAMP-binding protein
MYSTKEAADKLGLSQDHVRLLARTGKIKAKHLGHDWAVLELDYKRKRRRKAGKNLNVKSDRNFMSFMISSGTAHQKSNEITENGQQYYKSYPLKLFRQFQTFDGISQSELAKLAKKAVMLHVSKGETLTREGEISGSFYLIGKGMVRIAKIAPSGKQVTIATRYEGETIGILALIRGAPHFATVTALADTDVLTVKREDLLAFIESNPSIWHKLLLLEVERIYNLYNKIVALTSENASQRVINVLTELCARYGNKLYFTHQEIADMTGTTIETTTRILTRLRKTGIITSFRGSLNINYPAKLCL